MKKDKLYNYWQNQFKDHHCYMQSEDDPEFFKIREIIVSYLEPNSTLLDVGCASAGTYSHLKKYHSEKSLEDLKIKYKGVDFASNFEKENKKRFPDGNFETQDARELKEENNSWDTVLLYDTLDGMKKWEKAINEAIRVTKKRIIILIWQNLDKVVPEISNYLYLNFKLKELKGKLLEDLPINSHYMFIGDK